MDSARGTLPRVRGQLYRSREVRSLAVAIGLVVAYLWVVGDWMFGFRFFVPLLAPMAIVAGAGFSDLRKWRPRAAGAALVVWTVALVLTAHDFWRAYEREERRESWLAAPSLDPARFFAPVPSNLRGRRQVCVGERYDRLQPSGLRPFMLGARNIDDLGICTKFYAKLPTTDVVFTEVGRYSPLTPKPVLRAGEAYTLSRAPKLLLEPGGNLRAANGGVVPDNVLGGVYRLLFSTETVAGYGPIDSAGTIRDPPRYLENLAHISHLRRVWINGQLLQKSEYRTGLPYLYGRQARLIFDDRFVADFTFSDADLDVYELYLGRIRSAEAASVDVMLLNDIGHVVFRTTFELAPRDRRDVRLNLGEGVKAAALSVAITSRTPGPQAVDLGDLRLQGQTTALKRFVDEHHGFDEIRALESVESVCPARRAGAIPCGPLATGTTCSSCPSRWCVVAAGGLGVRRAAGGSPEQRARATWPVPDGNSDAYSRHLLLLSRRGCRPSSRRRVDCSRGGGALLAQKARLLVSRAGHPFLPRAGGHCRPRSRVHCVLREAAVKFERILQTTVATAPRSAGVFRDAMTTWLLDKLWIKSHLRSTFGIPPDRILFCEHHESHAASAFLCSPFDEAAILTVDGVGEWTTTAIGAGRGHDLRLRTTSGFHTRSGCSTRRSRHSSDSKSTRASNRVMGMAPYGTPRFVDEVRQLVRVDGDGAFALDLDYFSFHYSTTRTFTSKFEQLFGAHREPDVPFFTEHTEFPSYYGAKPGNFHDLARENQRYADIAASIQVVTEEILLSMARHAMQAAGSTRLCLAGGVALNSVANGRILRETPATDLYVQPAAGDSGAALGAAMYMWHVVLGNPRGFVLEHASWGAEPSQEGIGEVVAACGLPFEHYRDEEQLIDRTVELLAKGAVVGWAHGRFEWGPRALGHRSILADLRRADAKDIVNTKIKFREPYRPFAPSVPVEHAAAFFDLSEPDRHLAARFMLLVVPVRPAARDLIPAVTHVDGTRAPCRRSAPASTTAYHKLLSRFGQSTGHPGTAEYVVQPARRADRQHAAGGVRHVLPEWNGRARARSHDHHERHTMRVLGNVATGDVDHPRAVAVPVGAETGPADSVCRHAVARWRVVAGWTGDRRGAVHLYALLT